MNNEDNFTKLFGQIQILMKKFHRAGQEAYKFTEEGEVKAKNDKLRKTISEVTAMVSQTLNGLLKQLKTKT